MKARLRKPIEGLEVNKIYDIKIYPRGKQDITVRSDEPNWKFLSKSGYDHLQYISFNDILYDWELLQPVSDTTKQAIHSLVGNSFERGFQMGNTGWRQQNYDRANNTLEADILEIKQTISDAVVSVLEGKE